MRQAIDGATQAGAMETEISDPIDLVAEQRMRTIARGAIGFGLLSWIIALSAMPSIGGARWAWALGGAYVALILHAIVGPKSDGGLPTPYDPQEALREAMTPYRGMQELHERTEELAAWMDVAPVSAPSALEVLAPAPAPAQSGRRFQAAAPLKSPDAAPAKGTPATPKSPGTRGRRRKAAS